MAFLRGRDSISAVSKSPELSCLRRCCAREAEVAMNNESWRLTLERSATAHERPEFSSNGRAATFSRQSFRHPPVRVVQKLVTQIHRQLQRSRGWWNLAEPAAAVAFPEERRKQGGPKEPGNSAAFGCLSGPAPLKRIQCCPAGVRPRRVFSKRGEGTLLSERTTLTRIAVIGDTILCEGRRRLAKKVHAPTSFRIETNTRSYSFLCDAA